MKEKFYSIRTYGCQMNELDSDRISYLAESLGYKRHDDYKEADLIIYNTCAVRENAELKVYGHLGSLKSLKDKNPNLLIAVCGCMMEVDDIKKEIKNKYPHVDIIFGTKSITMFPYLIQERLKSKSMIVNTRGEDNINDFQYALRQSYPSAYVTIIYGCNNFCSYCIVPQTRGREASRKKESIIAEVLDLSEKGFKEITLLGQNVNSYGKDLYESYDFSDLLLEISDIPGIKRIRFMSSHPKDLSDKLIKTMAINDKIMNHFHLPLQSGSDRILKEMNRKYDQDWYLRKVKKLKSAMPNISITTDIIVGFPGETEEDFMETMKVIEEVKYDQVFLFKYSKRVGTRAASMEDQVDEDVVSKRFQRALKRINEICYERNSVYLGNTEEILVEGTSKDKEFFTGRTETFKIVNFKSDKDLTGKLVKLKIIGFNSFALEGSFESS